MVWAEMNYARENSVKEHRVHLFKRTSTVDTERQNKTFYVVVERGTVGEAIEQKRLGLMECIARKYNITAV